MTKKEAYKILSNGLANAPSEHEWCMAFEMAIEALGQTRWIPVSEGLPNLNDYTGSKVWQKKVLIRGYLSFDDTKEPFISEAFAKDVICDSVHDTVVTAWMPLPQLYKRESEEQDANND